MDLSTAIPVWDMAARLAAAAVCGAALGLDREVRGKAAGLRTHTLVAISAAVTTLVALELYWGMAGKGTGGGDMDPTRVIQGIAQAIGFISAGVMFRAGTTVRGATTAAVIWMAGALGIACGAGFYVLAGMALALCLAVTIVFSYALRWIPESVKSED
ncbi:MgtC/SapB family protein [Azospirillum brasilense]|uniref:MgtC/SapB family protein n=1 Tax=Azospirillum brasilense TaxID=192 RepID=UPI001EDBF647|nr:MgtC/SapB family protein [Azospirillum brasilense]UKJ74179.1 MgtC/SapB family protein [Azospirillum brasilense]